MTTTHHLSLTKYVAPRAVAVALLLSVGSALTGCGSDSTKARSSDTHTTKATTAAGAPAPEKVPDIDLPVTILGIGANNALPKRYTCDGQNVSPPIYWGKVPAGTKEIDILIATLDAKGTEHVQWAVAGIKPTLKSLEPGQTPPGAILGRNRYGHANYSICPPRHQNTKYVVVYFPLPERVPTTPGFNPLTLGQALVRIASHEGQYGFEYHRN